jgi:hypothetical protein
MQGAGSIKLADLRMVDQLILMVPQASFGRPKHHYIRDDFIHWSGIHGPYNLIEASIYGHSLWYSQHGLLSTPVS